MAWLLPLLFIVLAGLAELALLGVVGGWLGPLNAFLLVVATGVLGVALARREGVSVLRQLAIDAQQGLPPGDRLVEGALVVVGGLLLVLPGLISDLLGLFLVVPFTRRLVAPSVLRELQKRVTVQGLGVHVGPGARPRSPGATPAPAEPPRSSPFDHPVA